MSTGESTNISGSWAWRINSLAKMFHERSLAAGWWESILDGISNPPDKFEVGTKIALIHSEISEAMEAYRKDQQDDHLPHRKGVEVELADAMIRILELAGALGLDIGGAILEKDEYNSTRADHKLESRKAIGGKQF